MHYYSRITTLQKEAYMLLKAPVEDKTTKYRKDSFVLVKR